jgi:serine/threonine-protein kinase
MLQACEALAEAHSIGIVHRDIKPANFFLTRGSDGAALLKVLDFGISKAPTTGSNLTATQSVMGTPAYMSPEQMRSSRDVDNRSDIWSLGIVLYELLQGVPPYGGDTFSSMVIKVVTEPLPRMTVALPGDLESIVYRCLEKDPARRFQNVAELAQMLAPYAASQTQAAISIQRTRSIIGLENRRGGTDTGPVRQAIPPSTLSGAVGAHTTTGGGRRWPIFAGLGVLLAVVAVAVVASRGGGDASDGKKPDGATTITQPAAQPARPQPPPAASPPAPPPAPAVTTPVTTQPAPATPPPAAATTTPPAAPAAATPPPPTTTAATPAPATAPPDASTTPAQSAAVKPAAGTPDATGKKPKKPTKPGSGKPDAGSAKPPPDDDVLGTRN